MLNSIFIHPKYHFRLLTLRVSICIFQQLFLFLRCTVRSLSCFFFFSKCNFCFREYSTFYANVCLCMWARVNLYDGPEYERIQDWQHTTKQRAPQELPAQETSNVCQWSNDIFYQNACASRSFQDISSLESHTGVSLLMQSVILTTHSFFFSFSLPFCDFNSTVAMPNANASLSTKFTRMPRW